MDVYDDWYPLNPAAEVAAIRGAVPAGGRVLELGAGTGRLAVALADAGFDVVALDGSLAMLAVLAAKDPAGRVTRVAGDLVDIPPGPFDAVVLTRNTLFNVTRPAQDRLLGRVAPALRSGGSIWIEADEIDPSAPPTGCVPRPRTGDELVMTSWDHDAETSTVRGRFVTVEGRGHAVETRTWTVYYRSPSDLDRAAEAAGLALVGRHADWAGQAWPGEGRHVSRYVHRPIR
ncbi:MAG TPA: class I SAM-dependent methyltransferase [Acidimicrobiales bacterium]